MGRALNGQRSRCTGGALLVAAALALAGCSVAAISSLSAPESEEAQYATSPGKALNIKKDYGPAADGFARVGGKYGTKYKTFD